MRRFLVAASIYRKDLLRIGPDRPPEPRWNQDWFPRLDALAAYVMVRQGRPARIIEIGAGHSTRFMARALRDEGYSSKLISIDPEPRATLSGLDELTLIRSPLQDAPPPLFGELAARDFLFIDSSHVSKPGSDVALLFDVILPSVPAGLRVHFHDVFLPDDYPVDWAGRRYNEQYALANLLREGGWKVEFSSAYAVGHLADTVAASIAGELPLVEGARESSLWLRKL